MPLMKKYGGLFCFLFFTGQAICAQTQQTIDSIEKQERSCLENGYKQVKCITIFRRGMDSLMALVYRELYEGSDAARRSSLQKDQFAWLERQKAFDQKTDSQYSLEVAEKDFSEVAVMMSLSEKADFVRDRVKELVSRRGLRKK
jgi:uncharacterized protein YecT (DUF1311 family)